MPVNNGGHGAGARKQSMKLQRRADGTFAPGNRGGPGGAAHLKSRIRKKLAKANEGKAVELLNRLTMAGMDGNIAAAEVALNYLLGQPVKLSRDESALLRRFARNQIEICITGGYGEHVDIAEIAAVYHMVIECEYTLADALNELDLRAKDARRWVLEAKRIQEDLACGEDVPAYRAGLMLALELEPYLDDLPDDPEPKNQVIADLLRNIKRQEQF